MIMSNYFFYIICDIIFLMLFLTTITTSQVKRQWMSILSISITVIMLFIVFVEGYLNGELFSRNFLFLLIAVSLPQILTYIFSRRRKTIYKVNFHLDWLSFAIIFFVVAFAAIAPIIFSVGGETLFGKILRFVSSVIYAVFFILSIHEPTAIFQDGILYKGWFWSWKDIQDYKLIGNSSDKTLALLIFPKEELFAELVFYTKKMPFWNQKEIQVIVPEQKLELLSVFLEQSLSSRKGNFTV